MDWTALWLSLRLGVLTVLVLLPIAVALGRWLAYRQFGGKAVIEALVALPSCCRRPCSAITCSWPSAAARRSARSGKPHSGNRSCSPSRGFSSLRSSSTCPLRCSRASAVSRRSARGARRGRLFGNDPLARLPADRTPARLARPSHRSRAPALRIRSASSGWC